MLGTGDELVPPGTTPGPGEIVYSNGFALMALARNEGAEVIDLGIVPDRVDATVAAIRKARAERADILLTSGGAWIATTIWCRRGWPPNCAVVLEGRVAPGPPHDARQARRHAGDCDSASCVWRSIR